MRMFERANRSYWHGCTNSVYFEYMPLPRFERLPSLQRARILGIARRAFANGGFGAVSYDQLIVEIGISKTSAYQYFDGKNDLFHSVLDDVARRAVGALRAWEPSLDSHTFWSQLQAASNRLVAHLANNPDDLALIDAALSRASGGQAPGDQAPGDQAPGDAAETWMRSLLADGAQLGVIDSPLAPDLLLSVTAAVFNAMDRWAVERLTTSRTTGLIDTSTIDAAGAWETLARLWGTPQGLRMQTPETSGPGQDAT